MNDPKLIIKSLLDSGWNTDNTQELKPSISTGWYDTRNVMPQVTISDPVEVPESGGPSGYYGLGTGSGPSQMLNGRMSVIIWVPGNLRDAHGINPKAFLYACRREVHRLVRAAVNSDASVWCLAWQGGHESVDTQEQPVLFRFNGEVSYAYHES